LYSLGLLTLPSLYAFFALQANEQAVGVKEMLYGVPFIVVGLFFAFVSVRLRAVVARPCCIRPALHALPHRRFITNAGVPGWYPIFCFSVDVVIGAYLLWLSRRISNANLREA